MPKPFNRKMPATWWLRNSSYFHFMLRELTAVMVGAYCIVLLVLLLRIKQGSGAFDDMLARLQTVPSIAFHFLAFVAAMYHTVTWFSLLPKVLVVWRGEEKLPGGVLVTLHWLAWLAITAFLILFVFYKAS